MHGPNIYSDDDAL